MTSPPVRPDTWVGPESEDNPIVGDPDTIEATAHRLSSRSESVHAAMQHLDPASVREIWRARSGLRCADTVGIVHGRLREISRSYAECSQALHVWSDELRVLRKDAAAALEDGREARERLTTAESKLDELNSRDPVIVDPPLIGEPVPMAAAAMPAPALPGEADGSLGVSPPIAHIDLRQYWEQKAEEARADLDAAKQRLEETVTRRDDLAATTESRIREAFPRPLVFAR